MRAKVVLPLRTLHGDIAEDRIDTVLATWAEKNRDRAKAARFLLYYDHVAASLSEGMCPAHARPLGTAPDRRPTADGNSFVAYRQCPVAGGWWGTEDRNGQVIVCWWAGEGDVEQLLRAQGCYPDWDKVT